MVIKLPPLAQSLGAKQQDEPADFARVGLLGVNFRTAALDSRSSLSLTDRGCDEMLSSLKGAGIREALIVSTCNRTEIYFVGGCFDLVANLWSQFAEVPKEFLLELAYSDQGSGAVRQLFKVASGLDSALLGETEILRQLKTAHAASRAHNLNGRHLNFLVQRAFRASKRVRTETGLSRDVISIGAMALRKASHFAGPLEKKSVLVLGAGQIAERVAKELQQVGVQRGVVVNRCLARAAKLGERYGLRVRLWNELDDAILQADVIVCATASPVPILKTSKVASLQHRHRQVILDLGVPPNLEVDTAAGADLVVVDMESIMASCEENSQRRQSAVPHADAIVEEELNSCLQESLEREAGSVIEALVAQAEATRKANLDWALSLSSTDSAKERKLLEDLSIRMMRGMLAAPISALKKDLRGPVEQGIAARLFGLEALPSDDQ